MHEQAHWLRSHPLVFVDDLETPVLEEDDYRHFSRSLRMADGDAISVADGLGRWRPARLGAIVEVAGEIVETAPPPWPISIAFAPVKNQKPEWVVQKLTELGVDHIIPLKAERSVVRWDTDRANRHRERWAKVIREAAMQSRQVRLPTFDGATDLREVLVAHPDAALADPDGEPIGPGDRLVLIGPEGGWAPEETKEVALRRLPGGILRAETASIVAAALLANVRNVHQITLGG